MLYGTAACSTVPANCVHSLAWPSLMNAYVATVMLDAAAAEPIRNTSDYASCFRFIIGKMPAIWQRPATVAGRDKLPLLQSAGMP